MAGLTVGRPARCLLEIALEGGFRRARHDRRMMDDWSVSEVAAALERGEFAVVGGSIETPGWWFVGTDVDAVLRWLSKLERLQVEYREAAEWNRSAIAKRWVEVAEAKW